MEKRSKKVRSFEEVDRLSDLPDPIIHHILSFLDTKHAVRTSVLSKRWRDLWTTVSVLNFDSSSFRLLGSFKKFVIAVLNKLNRKSTADTFYFSYRGTIDDYHKKRVIYFAISHNVNHLVLDFGWKQCPVPQALLDCQTLKTIALSNFIFNKPSVCIALTSLHLQHCSFSYGGECCDLFECFLNLSNLRLHECDFGKFKVLKIHGPQLLKLSIISISVYFGSLSKSCKVEISAPKLTSFSYKDWLPLDFSVMNFPSLQHMDIAFSGAKYPGAEKEMTFQNLFKFFRGICNAQVLTLSYATIEALTRAPGLEDQQINFNRLKSLKLVSCLEVTSYLEHPVPVPVKVATFLLKGSPSAETILVEWRKNKLLECEPDSSEEGADPPNCDDLLVCSRGCKSSCIKGRELRHKPAITQPGSMTRSVAN